MDHRLFMLPFLVRSECLKLFDLYSSNTNFTLNMFLVILILFVFILPVYLYIVQNSIQNKHTHVYANGIVVTHSHPFDKDGKEPINDHKHSKREICLYSSLHFDFYDIPISFNLTVKLNELHKNYFVKNDQVDVLAEEFLYIEILVLDTVGLRPIGIEQCKQCPGRGKYYERAYANCEGNNGKLNK